MDMTEDTARESALVMHHEIRRLSVFGSPAMRREAPRYRARLREALAGPRESLPAAFAELARFFDGEGRAGHAFHLLDELALGDLVCWCRAATIAAYDTHATSAASDRRPTGSRSSPARGTVLLVHGPDATTIGRSRTNRRT